jgi:hypothetical protein
MRVYHLLPAHYALADLERRQIKVAQFSDMNDPFELLAVELSDKAKRKTFTAWRKRAAKRYGVLCFSQSWKNPVLWSHYGDKHKGICLGFDVRDTLLKEVAYTGSRLPLCVEEALQKGSPNQELVESLLCAKFEHWHYEEEVRVLLQLNEAVREENLYFRAFDQDLQLKEVIAGPRCLIKKAQIERLIKSYSGVVKIIKARLAFRSFEVVENKLGFRGS